MELLDKDKKFLRKYKKKNILGIVFLILWVINIVSVIVVSEIANIPNPVSSGDPILDTTYGKIYSCLFLSLFILPFICPIILSSFEALIYKKYCISEQEAINRKKFLLYDIKKYVPLSQRFCSLNPDARASQIELLKKWYCVEEESVTEYFLNREYDEEDWNNAVEELKEEELGTKKDFINRLFQLVILEDGIHNDEWNLMMQLIAQVRFNKNYIKYFKERYNPLRTEFDESEWKGNSSTTYALVSPKEYYDVLGLTEGASYEEIKRAYHDLALQHHPDLPKNADRTEECEKMMMKINEAYEKLRSKI